MNTLRFCCPECGENISLQAKFCRFCNYIISDKDRAQAYQKKLQARPVFRRDPESEQSHRYGAVVMLVLLGIFFIYLFGPLGGLFVGLALLLAAIFR